MLKTALYPKLSVWLAVLLFSSLVSCNIDDLIKNRRTDAKSKLKTSIAVVFVDAATGKKIAQTDVQLKVVGPGGGSSVDLGGSSKTSFTSKGGVVNFAISENATPTASAPVQLTLLANAQGYMQASQNVFIRKDGGELVVLNMVSESNLPAGVTQATATGSISGGKTTAVLTLSTNPSTGSVRCSTKLSIPAGTAITDAGGTALSGTITAKITHFNNKDEASLKALPGGLHAATNQGIGFFFSAGFVSLDLTDASGRVARNFSKPYTVDMEVPASTVNPETGAAVKAGDVVPLWSYDPNTGEWQREGQGTVAGPQASGNFLLTMNPTHMSWWNWDWKFGECPDVAATVVVSNLNTYSSYLEVKAFDAVTGQYLTSKSIYASNNGQANDTLELLNVPSRPFILKVYNCQNQEIGAVTLTNPCASIYNLNLQPNVQSSPGVHNVSINVQAKIRDICPDKPNVYLRPTLWLSIYATNYSYTPCGVNIWPNYNVVGGVLNVDGLIAGQEYYVYFWYDDEYYEFYYTFNPNDATMTLPINSSICSKF